MTLAAEKTSPESRCQPSGETSGTGSKNWKPHITPQPTLLNRGSYAANGVLYQVAPTTGSKMRIIKVEVDRDKIYTVLTLWCSTPEGAVEAIACFDEARELYSFNADKHELRVFFASASK